MTKPSNAMQGRGGAVGLPWDGKQSAGSYGNRVRKAEAARIAGEGPAESPIGDEAAIRALWRQGKRKEALSYGK